MVTERACAAARHGRSPSSAASCRASATSAASPPRSWSIAAPSVIAVSDISGGVHAEDGLDLDRRRTRGPREHGSLAGYPDADAGHERGAARAALRRARARRARGSGHERERGPRARAADRRGRERADHHRGRRDPRRPRHPGPARHPHERGRRHRLLLRVGAGSRPPVLGPRRDPRQARREAGGRVRPRLGALRSAGDLTLRTAALVARRSARSAAALDVAGDSTRERPRARRDGARPGAARRVASAQEAGRRLARGRRCGRCSSCDGGTARRASSRARRSSREVVRGRPRSRGDAVGDIAEPPIYTLDARLAARRGVPLLEERDLERVPVVEDGRLVGVLSRSVAAAPPGRGRAAARSIPRRLARKHLRPPRRERSPSYAVSPC